MKRDQLNQLQPQVLSRFEQIIGQGKLAHAYLFSGDFASFEMAIYLSQSLFCTESQNGLPCGHCRNCRLIEAEEFSDMTIVRPQGTVIKTDTVRELVRNFSQSGFESTKQVFLICEAEKMHPNAANSLLKVIEEPQSDIHIFLLTNQEEAVLSTIKSRTQIISFPKNQSALLRLLEEEGVLKTDAKKIAELASGIEEARVLAKNKAFQDLLLLTPKFVRALVEDTNRAYLLVPQLVTIATEKVDQRRLLDLVTLELANLQAPERMHYLEKMLLVRKMWTSNVNLQNALEYMLVKK